ncbi:MAG: fumarylacetoacetate hydrolase family protein [Rhodospirillaceae bacterium]|nr:fumarylacetoacetate hydrolase family protein [Rhodospirillaceae bacterium]
MQEIVIRQLAEGLARARLAGDRCEIANGDHPQTEADGYAIQDAATRAVVASGRKIGGYKIGLVTEQMRIQTGGRETLGVDTPVYGTMLADRIFQNETTVRHADFVQLYIEGEFAVRIARDVPPRACDYDRGSIGDFVESCFAAIEIVEFRLPYFDYTPPLAPLMIADNGSNWGAVVGKPVTDWHKLDIPSLRAEMRLDGRRVAEGMAHQLLGHPFEVLAWMANHMNRRGRSLAGGDIVLLGSVTPSFKDFTAPAAIDVEWDALGSVAIRIA